MKQKGQTTKTIQESFFGEDNQNSVKFNITSGGRWGAEIKVYSETPDQALKESTRIASQVEIILKEKNGVLK